MMLNVDVCLDDISIALFMFFEVCSEKRLLAKTKLRVNPVKDQSMMIDDYRKYHSTEFFPTI